ncbi:MAG: DUF2703 domain-containing protein [Gammaproteobacteria bacterium]
MNSIDIEWRYLEAQGNTCDRCGDTGTTLRGLVEELSVECARQGWKVSLKDTPLRADDPADIEQSNLVLINGQALENILPGGFAGRSECPSCCAFTGEAQTFCRTVEFNGRSHDAIPAALIREAVCRVANCC